MTCPICSNTKGIAYYRNCHKCRARIVRPEKMLKIVKIRQVLDDIMYVDLPRK